MVNIKLAKDTNNLIYGKVRDKLNCAKMTFKYIKV